MRKLFGLAVLMGGVALPQAQENYKTNWTGHRLLGLATGSAGIAANVVKFPILVRLGAADSAVFAASKLNGADIRFTKSDSVARLSHEIEKWDSAGRSAAIWVKVDTIYATGLNRLLMHWGNPAAVDSSKGSAVFDTAAKFQAVWHMKATAGNESDATANNFTLTAGSAGSTAPTGVAAGAVGSARGFDGTQKFFVALGTASSVLNFAEGGPFTLSSWVTRTAGNTGNRVIVNKSDYAYGLQQGGSSTTEGCDLLGTTSATWQCVTGPVLPTDTWSHLVYVRSAPGVAPGSAALYLNGALVTQAPTAAGPFGSTGRTSAANVHVGADKDGGYPGDETGTTGRRRFWNGSIDEVRMSNVARDSNWIKLEYANQKAAQTLVASVPANIYYVMPGVGNTPRDTMIFQTGVAVNQTLNYTGGPLDSVVVTTGGLPAGLTLNKATGALTGMPTVAAAASNQTITLYSAAGNATRGLRISVIAGATSNLHYGTDTLSYPLGVPVSVTPTYVGRAPTAFTVTPALPAGLTLNSTSGLISGTPTAVTAAANYAVKATNATDTASVTVRITIGAAEDFSTWTQHKSLWLNTQGNGANVLKTVRNFPVLVRLDSLSFTASNFAQASGSGADIRFTKADNVTRLPHQIDHWDSAGKKAGIWVLVDTISGSSIKNLRMHWGKAGAPNVSNGASVFRTADGFQGVWHMNGATTANEPDATPNGLTAVQTSDPVAVPGIIGGGRNFVNGAGTNDYMTVPGSAAPLTFPAGGTFTISAWSNLTSAAAHGTLVSKHDNAYALKLTSGSVWEVFDFNAGWNAAYDQAQPPLDVWQHIVGVNTATEPMLFINGVRADAGVPTVTTSGTARNDGIDLLIGAEPQSATTRRRPYDGRADEVRIAGVARDTAWVKLEYQNQRPTGQTLVAWAEPVSIGAGTAGSTQGFNLSMKALGDGMMFRVQGGDAAQVNISLSDMRGRPVWSRTVASAGVNEIVWNGTGRSGARVSNGVYALRVTLLDAENKVLQTLNRKVPFTR